MLSSDKDAVAVSIVVPVRNEADNVAPLIAEIIGALDGRWNYEIIYVNDGSTDATAERLAALMKQHPRLRQLKHATSSGQSAAVRSGVRAARGAIVATLDGDGQNNPVFLPDLIAAVEIRQCPKHFAPERLQAAPGIAGAIAKDGIAHAVGDSRLELLEAGVLATDPLTCGETRALAALFDGRNQSGQEGRIILSVTVERRNDRATRGAYAAAHRL